MINFHQYFVWPPQLTSCFGNMCANILVKIWLGFDNKSVPYNFNFCKIANVRKFRYKNYFKYVFLILVQEF